MRCAKHAEETAVSCGRCTAPVCPKCMVHSDMGVRCKKCAGDRFGKSVGSRSKVVWLGVAALAGIIAVGSIGSGAFGSNDKTESYDDYADGAVEEGLLGEVVTESVLDPWLPHASGPAIPEGRRFVAVEFTISVPTSAANGQYVMPTMFKLSDTDGFVYAAEETGKMPALPTIRLDPGEKTRGWVTFAINDDATAKGLRFFDSDIDVPLE